MWGLIYGLLPDHGSLRADLEAMIEREAHRGPGNRDAEAKAWSDRLAEADRMRAG